MVRDPAGKAIAGGEPRKGWVPLPGDKPGLWSFEPVENMLVRAANVPPFYAFCDPAHYFEPNIPWERQPAPEPPERVPADTVYVGGAINVEGDQALYLSGRRQLRLEAGDEHSSGIGGQFLPFHEGTIECFLKPNWSTFELPGEYIPFFRMNTDNHYWYLSYQNHRDKNPEWFLHVLYGCAYSDGPLKRITFRCYRRQTVFERGEWVHVAWVWGQRDGIFANRGKTSKNVLLMRAYVNGRSGNDYFYKLGHNLPADEPKNFVMDGRLLGAIDELRISDCQRYLEDFAPPSRDRPLEVDQHTRALFHFNGSVDGESHGVNGSPPVTLKH